ERLEGGKIQIGVHIAGGRLATPRNDPAHQQTQHVPPRSVTHVDTLIGRDPSPGMMRGRMRQHERMEPGEWRRCVEAPSAPPRKAMKRPRTHPFIAIWRESEGYRVEETGVSRHRDKNGEPASGRQL